MVDCSKIVLRVSKGKHNIYQLYTTLPSWPNIYIYICNVCDRDAMRTQAQHPTKPKHKLEQIRTERNEGNRNSFVLFTKTQIICSLYTLFSLRERVLKSVYVLREKLNWEDKDESKKRYFFRDIFPYTNSECIDNSKLSALYTELTFQ